MAEIKAFEKPKVGLCTVIDTEDIARVGVEITESNLLSVTLKDGRKLWIGAEDVVKTNIANLNE